MQPRRLADRAVAAWRPMAAVWRTSRAVPSMQPPTLPSLLLTALATPRPLPRAAAAAAPATSVAALGGAVETAAAVVESSVSLVPEPLGGGTLSDAAAAPSIDSGDAVDSPDPLHVEPLTREPPQPPQPPQPSPTGTATSGATTSSSVTREIETLGEPRPRTPAPRARPVEPGPTECCGNDCRLCVWTVYWEALQAWEEEQARLAAAPGTPTPAVGGD